MTTREHLKRRQKKALLWIGLGVLVCVPGAVYFQSLSGMGVVVLLAGFSVAISSMMWMQYEGRCLHCRQKISDIYYRSIFTKRIRCCPYCGGSLDEPVGAREER